MLKFSYDKYIKDREDTEGTTWARLADGKQAKPYDLDREIYTVDIGYKQVYVAREWLVDTELSDSEKWTVKKRLDEVNDKLYECWDILSGLSNTMAVDFNKQVDKIDDIKWELKKYKEELK